jgi:hypothetical protein
VPLKDVLAAATVCSVVTGRMLIKMTSRMPRVRSQGSRCGICDGRSVTGTYLSLSASACPPPQSSFHHRYIPTFICYRLCRLCSWQRPEMEHPRHSFVYCRCSPAHCEVAPSLLRKQNSYKTSAVILYDVAHNF